MFEVVLISCLLLFFFSCLGFVENALHLELVVIHFGFHIDLGLVDLAYLGLQLSDLFPLLAHFGVHFLGGRWTPWDRLWLRVLPEHLGAPFPFLLQFIHGLLSIQDRKHASKK